MAISEIVAALAEGFNAIRNELVGVNAQLVLLKEDGGAAPYVVLLTRDGEWYPKFSEFFGTTTFNVAAVDVEFAALVRKTTHLMIIDGDIPSLNNILHEMQAETAAPVGDKPYWRIRAKSVGRKYIQSEEI